MSPKSKNPDKMEKSDYVSITLTDEGRTATASLNAPLEIYFLLLFFYVRRVEVVF